MVLHHRFFEMTSRFGNKIAVEDTSTKMILSYKRFSLASRLVARRFQNLSDPYLGILLPTSAAAMLAAMGALMARKPPVMLNYSTGVEKNIAYGRKKCGFRTVLTSRLFLKKIKVEADENMIFIEDLLKSITLGEKLRALAEGLLPSAALKRIWPGQDDDTAVILFTSGSEKDPKAVVLSHHGLCWNLDATCRSNGMTHETTILGMLPLFHVFGFNGNFLLPLLSGMTVYTTANPLDFAEVARLIKEKPVTMAAATPVFWQGYLRKSEPGDWESLQILASGADKLPPALEQAVMEKQGKQLLEGYGTTETSPVISCNSADHLRSGSIGKPVEGCEIRIVDDEGRDLPPGTQGQIWVKSPGVLKEYLGDPEETADRVRDGWYVTGDLGLVDEDGFFWHKGRSKRFCKIGGEMISLVSVEESLQEILPEGVACCVVDVPCGRKGAKLVVAVSEAVKRAHLMDHLKKKLPSIALPREFFVIPEFPKMGSGKVSFREIEKIVFGKLGLKTRS